MQLGHILACFLVIVEFVVLERIAIQIPDTASAKWEGPDRNLALLESLLLRVEGFTLPRGVRPCRVWR